MKRLLQGAILFLSAASLRAQVAIDATVFGDQNTASTTVRTTAFSTTSGNELLLAFISADAPGSGTNTTVTGISSGSLTWSLVVRTSAQRGTAEVWRAFAPSALSAVTVTANLSQSVASSLTVISFNGVDISGANGSGAIGATVFASAPSGAPTGSLVTTRNNSSVLGVGTDWDNPINRTVGAGQTLIHQFLPSAGDTYW